MNHREFNSLFSLEFNEDQQADSGGEPNGCDDEERSTFLMFGFIRWFNRVVGYLVLVLICKWFNPDKSIGSKT